MQECSTISEKQLLSGLSTDEQMSFIDSLIVFIYANSLKLILHNNLLYPFLFHHERIQNSYGGILINLTGQIFNLNFMARLTETIYQLYREHLDMIFISKDAGSLVDNF